MVWILPTFNRPKQCAAVLNKLKSTSCSTPGIIFVNGNKKDYEREFFNYEMLPQGWRVIYNSENIGAIGALNKIFELYPNEDFYGFIGDDEFVEGENWDTKLIGAAGKWNFSHGLDNIHQGKRAQGYLCLGGDLVRAVGFIALRETWHWYGLDDMWETLEKTGICKNILVPEVKVVHRHPMDGVTKNDACYELGESQRHIDYQVFAHFLRNGLKSAVERIRQAKNS